MAFKKDIKNRIIIILFLTLIITLIMILIIYGLLFSEKTIIDFVIMLLTIIITLSGGYSIFLLEMRNKKGRDKKIESNIIKSALNEVEENINYCEAYKKHLSEFRSNQVYTHLNYDFSNVSLKKLNESVNFTNIQLLKKIQTSLHLIKIINRLVKLNQYNNPILVKGTLFSEITELEEFLYDLKIKKQDKSILLKYLNYLKDLERYYESDKKNTAKSTYNDYLDSSLRKEVHESLKELKKGKRKDYIKIWTKLANLTDKKTKYLFSLSNYLTIFEMNEYLIPNLKFIREGLENEY